MPLITPPSDRQYPDERQVVNEDSANRAFRDRWVKWYLDCPNWICPVCTTTMFGRSKYCAYCWECKKIKTLRPDWYKENTYAEVFFGRQDAAKTGE